MGSAQPSGEIILEVACRAEFAMMDRTRSMEGYGSWHGGLGEVGTATATVSI